MSVPGNDGDSGRISPIAVNAAVLKRLARNLRALEAAELPQTRSDLIHAADLANAANFVAGTTGTEDVGLCEQAIETYWPWVPRVIKVGGPEGGFVYGLVVGIAAGRLFERRDEGNEGDEGEKEAR